MQIDLTQIALAILSLLSSIITAYIIPQLRNKRILRLIRIGVKAAEKKFDEPGMGEKKNEYVKKYLASKGYALSMEEVDVMIDSVLFDIEHALPEED